MKSDREFLDGIYEKAKEMEVLEQRERATYSRLNGSRKALPMRFALTAAACFVFVSLGLLLYDTAKPKDQVVPQPSSIDIRGIDLQDNIQDLFDTATEIAAVKWQGENSLEIEMLYRHSMGETRIKEELAKVLVSADEGGTAVVFLKAGDGGLELLDTFTWDKSEGTYRNSTGEVLAQERLDEGFGK